MGIYFVAETVLEDGTVLQSEKFNCFSNAEGKTAFNEVFQITESAAFENYEEKEELMSVLLSLSYEYFLETYGDTGETVNIVAVDETTDIFQWGIDLKVIDEENLQYTIIDWKKDGSIFKYTEEIFQNDWKITNKVTEPGYIQWIEKFVRDVLDLADLCGENVVIEDIEYNRRISLTIDGEEYSIRTWNFYPEDTDKNGKTCAEKVQYTLFQMVEDEQGAHGEEVDFGMIRIEWEN